MQHAVAQKGDALGRISGITTTKPGDPQETVVPTVAYHPFGGLKGYTLGNGQGEYMTNERFLKVKRQLPELRKLLVDSPYGRIPKSITFLETELTKAQSQEDKAALYTLILSECSRSKNQNLSIRFLRQQVRDLPNDPLAVSSLASQLALDSRARDEALALAAEAVILARKQDRQIRYSLTCQARIALNAADYHLFNNVLRALIDDAANQRSEDHGFEFDFLDQVDQAKVDQALLSRYRALAD